jgi:hypothetical protein
MLSVILVLVAVNLLGYLVVYLLLRERVRRAASPAAQATELREEVNRLVIDLNQTTDRNLALLEDKITSLSELLTRADKKIALLKRESEKHDVGARVYSRILEGRTPAAPEASPVEEPPPRAEPRPAAPAVSAASPGAEAGNRGPVDVREQVIALYKAGFSASLIAARVGAPKGEVDLIIALSERKGFA